MTENKLRADLSGIHLLNSTYASHHEKIKSFHIFTGDLFDFLDNYLINDLPNDSIKAWDNNKRYTTSYNIIQNIIQFDEAEIHNCDVLIHNLQIIKQYFNKAIAMRYHEIAKFTAMHKVALHEELRSLALDVSPSNLFSERLIETERNITQVGVDGSKWDFSIRPKNE